MTENVKHAQVTLGAGNKPVCTPDPLLVDAPDTLIVFALDAPGWAFRPTHAVVPARPDSDFPCASWTVSPQQASLLDLARKPGQMPYSVFLVNTETGERLSFDPTIRNRD